MIFATWQNVGGTMLDQVQLIHRKTTLLMKAVPVLALVLLRPALVFPALLIGSKVGLDNHQHHPHLLLCNLQFPRAGIIRGQLTTEQKRETVDCDIAIPMEVNGVGIHQISIIHLVIGITTHGIHGMTIGKI